MSEPAPLEVRVTRRAHVPDPLRIERCARAPELGPRVAFLSGGSALRSTCRVLKHLTHNSVHLITPFDSGGSSAVLREAFRILGVGDLRNRLMALAEESDLGNPEVSELFSYRLAKDGEQLALERELSSIVEGDHPLVRAIPSELGHIIRIQLRKFVRKVPAGFDLRGASIGNLVLVGGYLVNQHDLDSVLYLFSKLVSVRGTVRPTALVDAHLRAHHAGGRTTRGQHLLGKPATLERGPILDLDLVATLDAERPLRVDADPSALRLLERADLCCFPMGSFFGSVLANLLPRGIGRTLAALDCPKVYVPNTGDDPEMRGYRLSTAVERLLEFARRDAGTDVPVERVLHLVLLDTRGGDYSIELDVERVERLGVRVLDLPLAGEERARLDPTRLAEALVSLA